MRGGEQGIGSREWEVEQRLEMSAVAVLGYSTTDCVL